MKLGAKLRYLREVEGTLRGLGRAMTQQEIVRSVKKELGKTISQSYLSQIESGARPHLTTSTRMLLARFFKVRARAALDLREIGLADRLAELFLDRANDFLLCHRASQSAKRALDFAQVSEFGPEFHIANCDLYITDCNICQEAWRPLHAGKQSRQVRRAD